MEENKAFEAFTFLQNKVANDKLGVIKSALDRADETKFDEVITAKYYDSTICIILSLFLGVLGINRFYIKDIGLGVLKVVMFIIGFLFMVSGVMLVILGGIEACIILTAIGGIIYFIVGVFNIIDIFLCYNKCKTKNFNTIMNILH